MKPAHPLFGDSMPSSPHPDTTPATVYTDHDSLISDMQLLLTDTTLCDTTILVADETPVAIPSQILRARSPYFAALLSDRWKPPPGVPLSKPNAPLPVFHDLLEYLVTGAVTLSLSPLSIPHNVYLIALAHEVALTELEASVLHHISRHLNVQNLPIYLRAIVATRSPPPLQLEDLLCTFVTDHISAFNAALAAHDWQLMQVLWRLLVNAHAQKPFSPEQVSAAARAIMNFSTLEKGKILRIPQLIALENETDREHMLAFLRDAAPLTFAAAVEPAGFYSDDVLLAKYRDDAMQPREKLATQPKKRPRWRVLCESEHPHRSGARLDRTTRHIVVPVERDVLCDSLLRFDKRSSLGSGAELTFYTRDPALGTDVHTFLVGSSWHREVVLPGTEFWYAFASPNADVELDEDLPEMRKWGWRFFVEPITPAIDEID